MCFTTRSVPCLTARPAQRSKRFGRTTTHRAHQAAGAFDAAIGENMCEILLPDTSTWPEDEDQIGWPVEPPDITDFE